MEVFIPCEIVEVKHNAYKDFDIIYCETTSPPEYWFYCKEEERYTEEYAIYLDAYHETWCGNWGILAYNETDSTAVKYIREVIRNNPELHTIWGCPKRFIQETEQYIRFNIFGWLQEKTKDYPFKELDEKLRFNAPVREIRKFIREELCHSASIKILKEFLNFYDELFCEVWNKLYHQEEYLFYRWEIYGYALEILRKQNSECTESNELYVFVLREYNQRKEKLIQFRTEWEQIILY